MKNLTQRACASAGPFALLLPSGIALAQVTALPEVTVTGTREKALLNETPAAVGAIKADTVRQDRPTHPT